MRIAITVIQALTFPGLAYYLIRDGDLRLGLAQILLGIVTVLVYS